MQTTILILLPNPVEDLGDARVLEVEAVRRIGPGSPEELAVASGELMAGDQVRPGETALFFSREVLSHA